jgi:hypothetical protein
MPALSKTDPGMSDAAVKAKTGKTWPEWFAVLDKAGAKQMTHPQIATYLAAEHGVPGWWCQMVTVGYERAHGRAKHERPDGYSISVSKTVAVPVAKLFRAWNDPRSRARWLLEAPFTIRKATLDKSLRVTWGERENLSIGFYDKGESKSQVALEHSKLRSAKEAAKAKVYWAEAMERLYARLEK